jgi:N-carbamoyl-L-amino-acid hydrolase
MGLMRDAGLSVRIDPAGNILGRRDGRETGLPVILFGSHIDSVPDGGNYDGDVGSLAAIESVRTMQERGMVTRHPLEVVVFQNEEGGTVGSKLMAAGYTEAELDRMARSGKTIREGIGIVGGDVARLGEARRKPGDLRCYFELHIEQGGTLDEAGIQIGVVEGIVGIRWFEVTIDGFANHAGTTPMNRRQDAMLAAARVTLMVNEVVRAMPGRQVGTVGRLTAVPGTVNVVPGRVVLTIDLRDLSADKLAQLSRRFEEEGRRIAAETGTTINFRLTSTNEPAPADPRMRRIISESARSLGLSQQNLPSAAGHDAQEIARIAPMGMIFIPSVGGISHSPKEFSRPDDITNGANVLLNAVLAADQDRL